MKKAHLISGACGFVGRNLVKRLLQTHTDSLFIVDDHDWKPKISLEEGMRRVYEASLKRMADGQ
ncbi:MAG: hypothetical protein ACYC1Q_02060 [Bacteroidia bacterium]